MGICSCLEQYDILGQKSVLAWTPSQELRASQAITWARTLSVLAAFSERDLFMDNDRHRLWAPADIYSRVAFSCQSFLNKACHLKMARGWAPLFYLALFLSLATGPAPIRFFSPRFPCPEPPGHPAGPPSSTYLFISFLLPKEKIATSPCSLEGEYKPHRKVYCWKNSKAQVPKETSVWMKPGLMDDPDKAGSGDMGCP